MRPPAPERCRSWRHGTASRRRRSDEGSKGRKDGSLRHPCTAPVRKGPTPIPWCPLPSLLESPAARWRRRSLLFVFGGIWTSLHEIRGPSKSMPRCYEPGTGLEPVIYAPIACFLRAFPPRPPALRRGGTRTYFRHGLRVARRALTSTRSSGCRGLPRASGSSKASRRGSQAENPGDSRTIRRQADSIARSAAGLRRAPASTGRCRRSSVRRRLHVHPRPEDLPDSIVADVA
jgi:hypothetical protein